VEGKGRVFTRKPGENRWRRHDDFATAFDLEWLLLRQRQHETATRIAAAALVERAPRFLVAHGLKSGRFCRAPIRLSFT